MPNFKTDKDLGFSSGSFVKLKSGESIKGVFRGDPVEFHCKWIGKTTQICDKDDPDAMFRFRLNLVVKDGPEYTARIFEQGVRVYQDLRSINEEFDLEKTVVKITRTGDGSQTRYNIMPSSDKADLAAVKKVPLQSLRIDHQPKRTASDTMGDDHMTEEDIPF